MSRTWNLGPISLSPRCPVWGNLRSLHFFFFISLRQQRAGQFVIASTVVLAGIILGEEYRTFDCGSYSFAGGLDLFGGGCYFGQTEMSATPRFLGILPSTNGRYASFLIIVMLDNHGGWFTGLRHSTVILYLVSLCLQARRCGGLGLGRLKHIHPR